MNPYRLFSNLFFLLVALQLNGQSALSGAEYFWNVDPGQGNATALSATDGSYDEPIEEAFKSGVNAPNSSGIALFCVRFKDYNGDWGPVFKRSIATQSAARVIKITAAEFFWGVNDPGPGSGLAMIAFDGAFDAAIETALQSNLNVPTSGGLQLFNIRIKDENGNWGPVFKRSVVTEISGRDIKITAAEYFWGLSDPGAGSGTPMVAFDGAFDDALEIAIKTGLTALTNTALQLFNVRIKDENGNWGPVFKRSVVTENAGRDLKITSAEYFWGLTDPGVGSGTSMVAFDGAFDDAIETALKTNLTAPNSGGLQLFNVRIKDDNGNWGPVFKRAVVTENNGRDIKISAAEYFWGISDPGAGSGIAMVAFDGAFDDAIETALRSNLTTPSSGGLQLFNVRIKDENGNWGPVFKRSIITENTGRDIKISAAEYFWGLSDPGAGSGTPMVAFDGAFDDAIEMAITNSLNSPGVGLNLFNVRLKDDNSNWGPIFKRTVYIEIPSNFLEIVSDTSSNAICTGDSLLLIASGLDTYNWSPNSSISSSSGDSVWVSPTATTTYYVNGTNSAGSFEEDSITITVYPTPIVSFSGVGSVYCNSGQAVTLNATPNGGVFSGPGVTGNLFDPSLAGIGSHQLLYSFSNSFGCTADTSILVSVSDLTSSSVINPISCDSYLSPLGNVYTSSGTYVETLTNSYGCDSTITINLQLNTSTSNTISANACNTYLSPAGNTYSSSGVYTDTIPSSSGCDSIITINLTISNFSSYSFSQTACEGYTLNGQTYTSSGTYTQVVTNSIGCDSIITLDLTINNSTSSSIFETSCAPYISPSGTPFYSSGTYTDVVPNFLGCDSLITINLTIISGGLNVITTQSCESYSLNGQTYNTSGSYTQNLAGASSNGCDSTITLNLIVNSSTSSTVNVSSCGAFTSPSGAIYTASGTYTDIIPNSVGCDSTITINLTVVPGGFSIINASSCNLYSLNGQNYSSSGSYTQTLPGASANGCDSTIVLNLTISNTTFSTITETSCGNYTSPSGSTFSSSGTYTDIISNASGCDSIITINLTILNEGLNIITTSSCDNYVLNGQFYNSSGTYTQTLPGAAANGCDSTITLNLIINQSTSSVLNETSCGGYTLNGQTYSSSGTYFQQLTSFSGCDSTITLNLTIISEGVNIINAVECGAYSLNGQTYTSSGTFSQILPAASVNGCDSTITLNLIINNPSNSEDSIVACNSYTWIDGITYNSSNNTATHVIPNSVGCDSTILLNLTINYSTQSTITATVIDSLVLNGQTYTQSGIYTQIIPNVDGCDSTITIDLTVGYTFVGSINSNNLSIYPNPTNGNLTIDGVEFLDGSFELYISDLYGKVVQVSASKTSSLDISDFESGIYFINILNNKSRHIFRVVKK